MFPNSESIHYSTPMSDDIMHWYALRVFHRRTAEVLGELRRAGWRTYMPMRRIEDIDIHYNESVREEPVIPSLVFLRASSEYIMALHHSPTASARPYYEPGTTCPAVISDHEMDTFIYVTTHGCRQLDMVPTDFVKGDRVRVTEGIFRGAEGYITRVHGTKRFVVVIEGIAAVATSYIPGKYLEKITSEG